MRKAGPNKAATAFEAIRDEHPLFYNRESGEFDFYIAPIYPGIEDGCRISCPSRGDTV